MNRATKPHAAPEDLDEHGHYLYPGDVEDAMPEGNAPRRMATYIQETILRDLAAPERDSAYANLPIYYRKGEPGKHVSPDAFFLPGVPFDDDRVSYRLWEEGVTPTVVFEILSKGSELKDRVKNRAIYQNLGIPEYYWFDPKSGELEALELDRGTGKYRERTPNAEGRYFSAALRAEVGLEKGELGLYRNGTYLLPTEELRLQAEQTCEEADRARKDAERGRKKAEQARDAEMRARREAEEELRRVREELDRLRRGKT